jgi:hypothetical protein
MAVQSQLPKPVRWRLCWTHRTRADAHLHRLPAFHGAAIDILAIPRRASMVLSHQGAATIGAAPDLLATLNVTSIRLRLAGVGTGSTWARRGRSPPGDQTGS